jgi:hypothetical protein
VSGANIARTTGAPVPKTMKRDHANDHPHRGASCTICEALPPGAGAKSAEGRYETTLLCSRHAALLELEDISDALALLGIVLGLEKWLEGHESSADKARSLRVRYLRDDVLDELWFTCGQAESGHRELREEQATLAR